ncbi:MAG TPA: LptF/LptG family permease [Candidatus Omnitrophota bacterium]|nr:LptF/LptG family permease [Candidatus Omnitrophota bacterium]HRY84900.1 LptF/LptG family permease [Candidatus Omnitrophota bacterium]
MKILQRYVLKELLLPCVLCFTVLSFIFMAGYLVKAADMIIGRGVSLGQTLYVLLLVMPSIVSYTAPMSLLTGVLIVFGNFSQHNEFRAMKASGVHPLRFMMPPLILGFALSVLMFVFNDQVGPPARFELRRATKKMIMQHPMALIEPGRFVKISSNILFLAKRVEGNEMKDIVAHEGVDSENPVRTIVAESGKIVMDPNTGQLEVQLFNGSVSESQDEGVQSVQFKTYKFPTLDEDDIRKMGKKKKDMTLAEILVDVSEKTDKKTRRELWAVFHQRIAFAFGSLVFAFIGIPIASIVKRGEVVISFGISMAATSVYYILFALAQSIASRGGLPPVIVLWLPNIILIGIGTYLLRRAILS